VQRPAKRNATYEDLLEVPEHLVAEIIDGDLITSPRPAPSHAAASSALGALLGGPFRFGIGGPGGWILLDEPELHVGASILVPDLAGWRRERMPERPTEAFFTIAPDWLCEVPSPSTAALDRAEKLPRYAEAGIGHVWLIDPLLQILEVYRRQDSKWVLLDVHQGDLKVRAEPFAAIEIDLTVLWSW
jgi:Uma2 family endonuclease